MLKEQTFYQINNFFLVFDDFHVRHIGLLENEINIVQ